MIAITGANGQLGKLVVKGLLNVIPADEIIAAVRNPENPTICALWAFKLEKPITIALKHC